MKIESASDLAEELRDLFAAARPSDEAQATDVQAAGGTASRFWVDTIDGKAFVVRVEELVPRPVPAHIPGRVG